MRLVSFDPGLREAGLAVFDGGRLVRAGLLRNPEQSKRGAGAWYSMAIKAKAFVQWDLLLLVDVFVTEEMVVRKGGAYSSDLLQLNGVAGMVGGILDPMEAYSYTPEQWKKQVPKSIHNRRTLAKLSPQERLNILDCPDHLMHNIIDAVGLGLFHIGR